MLESEAVRNSLIDAALTWAECTYLASGASVWGLRLDDLALSRFDKLARLLDDANSQFNLTRIRREEIVPLHFLDSLALAACRPVPDGARIVDVGTGAGFPGLPLAIAYPNASFTLVDGTRKRVRFVERAIEALGLANARTLHARAEELAERSSERASYDLVTARAVAPLPRLLPWLLPLARPGGHAIAYKSRDVAAEIEAAMPGVAAMHGKIGPPCIISLPGTDIMRTIVTVEAGRSPSRIRADAAPDRKQRQHGASHE